MKTKKNKTQLDYEVEDFTPSFYLLAIIMLIGMLVSAGLVVCLIIFIAKILTGSI